MCMGVRRRNEEGDFKDKSQFQGLVGERGSRCKGHKRGTGTVLSDVPENTPSEGPHLGDFVIRAHSRVHMQGAVTGRGQACRRPSAAQSMAAQPQMGPQRVLITWDRQTWRDPPWPSRAFQAAEASTHAAHRPQARAPASGGGVWAGLGRTGPSRARRGAVSPFHPRPERRGRTMRRSKGHGLPGDKCPGIRGL